MAKVSGYIGKHVGNYRVTAKIASGSYGTVYRAQHTILSRVAAIKMMHVAHLNSQKERDDFLKCDRRTVERCPFPTSLSWVAVQALATQRRYSHDVGPRDHAGGDPSVQDIRDRPENLAPRHGS